MSGLTTRLMFEVEDFLRFNHTVRSLTSSRWRRQAMGGLCDDDQARFERVRKLCSAATLCPDPGQRLQTEQLIRDTVAAIEGKALDWSRLYPQIADPQIPTAVILKPSVSSREPGVLLISFEKQWTKLLYHGNARELAERYTLIIGPSWTPPHSCGVTVFPKLYPDRIFSTISHEHDMIMLPRLSDKIVPVPLLASNWVNPDDFQPLPRAERDIDIVIVATFGKYKRHFAFLKALAQMPKTVRVLLVGTNNPDLGASGIRRLARAYGVEDCLVGVGGEDYAGVVRAFCRAKISVIMSRREGSCQAVVESMFADTPVGILQDAEMGSSIYVNEHTGKLLSERRLAEDILELLERSATMSPRRWAMEHGLSCQDSTRVLNDILRQHALDAGQEWTRDLAVHAWNPYPELVPAADGRELRDAYRDIHQRFGFQIGPLPARWEVG